ncbi:MAG: AMP-binding protein [Acidobacteriota bacterium]
MSEPILNQIEATARLYPNLAALRIRTDTGNIRYTFSETVSLAKNVALALMHAGLEKGDRVAFWARIEPNWVIAYLGVLYGGGVVVPLDVEYGIDEVAAILKETEARIVFTTREKADEIREIANGILRIVALDHGSPEKGMSDVEEFFQRVPVSRSLPYLSGDDDAIIFYTSGTTGKAKGVVIQHQSISTSVLGILQHLKFIPGDNTLALIPAHHVFAALATIFLPLAKGASVTYLRALNSAELLRTMREDGITVLPAVPQLFYLLHDKIMDEVKRRSLAARIVFSVLLRSCYWIRATTGFNFGRIIFRRVHQNLGGKLRLLISAAAYFDPKVIRDFHGLGFLVQQGYGLTETFGAGTFTPFYKNVHGSAGVPIPGTKVKIENPDESGVGEIAIAGSALMRGYFNDPNATAEVLRNGWFYTGDLGYRDVSDNYYITGRRKEMIVLSSGKKIYPEDVERQYLKIPYIKEICVLGVSDTSDHAGSERLHAVIVPDFDYLKQEKIANAKVIIHREIEKISAKVPAYKRIHAYDLQTEPLPRTSTRKLLRWAVKQRVNGNRQQQTGPERQFSFVDGDDLFAATVAYQRVVDVIRGQARDERDVHLDMNLELDLGFDSLQRIELMANVEQALGIQLSDAAASQCLTVRDLVMTADAEVKKSDQDKGRTEQRITWKQILSAPSHDEMAEKYVLAPRPISTAANFVFLKFLFLLAKLLFQLKVRGRENLPLSKPYIICPNHQSYVDGVLIPASLPYSIFRDLFSLGHSVYFGGGIKESLARFGRVVPIDPDTNLRRAMKISGLGLKAGKVLLVFPEGFLTIDGELKRFGNGAAILARELQVPIVPIAIKGSYHVWSKTGGFKIAPVEITIGQAIEPSANECGDNQAYEVLTNRVREAVAALLRT